MTDLATMVLNTYGKICFFIPIPPRTQFRNKDMSIGKFYNSVLDTNLCVAEHFNNLPYMPLVTCRDNLILDIDGVHYTELSYRVLGHRAGQHIRREMAILQPRITRPRTSAPVNLNLPPPQNLTPAPPCPALPPPQNPTPALPIPSLPLAPSSPHSSSHHHSATD